MDFETDLLFPAQFWVPALMILFTNQVHLPVSVEEHGYIRDQAALLVGQVGIALIYP